jgi:hypothetical protein
MRSLRFRPFLALLVLLAVATGCKKSGGETAPDAPLRLGFFPNVTHGQALVGHAEGLFAKQPGVGALEVKQFNAGPAAMEALVAGALDVSYVGPGPAINTYLKAGRELRIIAGAANGGAVLVTRTAKSPAELKGSFRFISPDAFESSPGVSSGASSAARSACQRQAGGSAGCLLALLQAGPRDSSRRNFGRKSLRSSASLRAPCQRSV